MKIKRVAVIRGGPSAEYAVSMETGKEVLNALARLRYPTKDIVISKTGEWLDSGVVRRPEQILGAIDVVFIALHGNFGEDGSVQRFLKRLHLPFTGSNAFASAIALNKDLTKKHLRSLGIKMPKHTKLTRESTTDPFLSAQGVISMFGPAYVVKPVSSGSSLGTQIVRDQAKLAYVINDALREHESIMVEELITGKEATVAVLEGYRNSSLYRFPPIEIVPPADRTFFDFDSKYSGMSSEICPGRFSGTEKEALLDAAAKIHRELGLSQYSRSDFIVKNGEPYFLEINTLPGLTRESLFPKAVAAVGGNYDDLIDHLIETAIAN